MLGGEGLGLGAIISLFITWENSRILFQVQQHFFGIYFSHPIGGLLLPCTRFHKRLRTTPDTLQSEYLRSGLWAATHESFLIEKVSEWAPQEERKESTSKFGKGLKSQWE